MIIHEKHIRRSFELALEARERGDHPFGALLVGADGRVISEALNSVETDADPTGHAETNLVRAAARIAGPSELASATLYTSTEPCAMCAGAIYWAGVRRVVYGLPEARLRELTGDNDDNPTLAMPCREVFSRGRRETVVIGPVLGDEAEAVHVDFW